MSKKRIDSAMGFDRPVALATTWILVVVSSAWGQLGSGFDDLQARLGSAAPTGAGIGIGQGEAIQGNGYAVAPSNYPAGFITLMSGSQAGASAHAQSVLNLLLQRAPGVSQVWAWEALDFLQGGFLRFGGPAPLFPPAGLRVFNHSWIATGEDAVSGNDVIRRFDYQVTRDQSVSCVGCTNGTPYLLAGNFNGISVGDRSGASSPTPGGGRDGAGRMKPDIAQEIDSTESGATPRVAAAAALLLETALTHPSLAGNPRADDAAVIKSVILAGAVHGTGVSDGLPWSNSPAESGTQRGRTSTPLDPRFGSGYLNVDRSHQILTAGEQASAVAIPSEATAGPRGWTSTTISSGSRRYWRFSLHDFADEVTVLATWPRVVASNFASWSLMNIDLTLHRVDGTTLIPLTGDDGLPYFSSGNVVSESSVDNVELLVVRDLAPGDYVFEIYRHVGATSTSVAVAWIMPETVPPAIIGDINGDGQVNGADLGLLLIEWGDCPASGPCTADLNLDLVVNGVDLGMLLQNWGAGG
jgi:hypothetical protein